MTWRRHMLAGWFLGLAACCSATYTARLWFADETTGASGAGALEVRPGDLISMSFSFHRDPGDTTSRWTVLQAFIDLAPAGPNGILTDADANTWDLTIRNYFKPAATFPVVVYWQPNDGTMYDSAVDPSDDVPGFLTSKGIYALVGVKSTVDQSISFDAPSFYQFHVGSDAQLGAELHWGREGLQGDVNGIATRLWDGKNNRSKVTDNWLVVAPEPGTLVVLGAGLGVLLALRRRA